MDYAVVQLIARLKIRLRQDLGIYLNTERFFNDHAYAMQALDAAEESENIEVIATALEIRIHFGWIDTPKSTTPLQSSLAWATGC